MADTQELEQNNAAAAEAVELSMIDEIMSQTKMKPDEEGYDVAKRGVEELLRNLLTRKEGEERVDKALVDGMIAEIDKKMSAQLDEVLHHADFQKLESAWRGLKLVVDRTNFRENVKLELLNVSKEQLLEDFEDAPEVVKSGLYKHVYTEEYGTYGGSPVGAMVANYEFTPGAQDIALLKNVAAVAAMAHAPFIASAGPRFFKLDDFQQLPNQKDIQAILEGPEFTKWRSFRESEDARYVGLTLPRFLLRLPYGEENKAKGFNYEESVVGSDHHKYLWGNTSYAFATRITDSFAKFRWCPNIIGPQGGGMMEDLPLHNFQSMGQIETKSPTEVQISDRREFELAEEGFIPLTMHKDSDHAVFFSANSVQKPKSFPDKGAETNYKLGTQLPYMFTVSRLAHYLKVMQRDNIGSSKERVDIENELNTWIRQYVADQDGASAEVRARRPLRQARVAVEEVEGEPGWYRTRLEVRPHFKYMGADFTLSLVGKLDKS